ncbi:hypothetical protein HK102_003947, partial [Quaeritorhiza haematococci]
MPMAFFPLLRIELRLFRLFFFDVLESLPEVPDNEFVDELRTKLKYVGNSLLRMSASGGQLADQHESTRSVVLHAPDLHPDGLVTKSTAAKTQQQTMVSGRFNRRSQQLGSAALPTLPPELVTCILQHLNASISWWIPRRVANLAQCALVKWTWYRATLPLLWANVRLDSSPSKFRFLRGSLSICCVPKGNRLQYWPSAAVLELDFSCTGYQEIWRTLAQNLLLFPKLRRLTLRHLPSPSALSLLFDQDLPSLEHLSVQWEMDDDDIESWDHAGARAFFSRLASVDFNMHNYCVEGFDRCLDAAHRNLRQISFPEDIPNILARQFFDSCSNALSVVRMDGYGCPISGSTLEVLARKCEGLRALDVQYDEKTGIDAFKYLMLRGSQIVALRLYG